MTSILDFYDIIYTRVIEGGDSKFTTQNSLTNSLLGVLELHEKITILTLSILYVCFCFIKIVNLELTIQY